MAFLLYEAAKLSRNPLATMVLKAISTSDQMMAAIQFQPMAGESERYLREKSLPTVEFVEPGVSTITNSEAEFDQVHAIMRAITSDVDVSLFAEEQQQDLVSQRAIQLEKKLKALGRKLGEKLVTGKFATSVSYRTAAIAGVTIDSVGPNQDSDRHGPAEIFYDQSADTLQYRAPGDRALGAAVDVSSNGTYTVKSDNPSKRITVTIVAASTPGADAEAVFEIVSTTNEFDGFEDLIADSQLRTSDGTDGDALTFERLDELIDLVKVPEDVYFVSNGAVRRQFMALLRSTGGATPADMSIEGINRPVPTYRGIPWLKNDHIESDESKGANTDLSSVYLVSMEPNEGLRFNVGQAGSPANVDIDPRDARILGVKLREIGELETKEVHRTRLSWYGTTRLGSELAIARASEIQTS